jgi:hypothetical protein
VKQDGVIAAEDDGVEVLFLLCSRLQREIVEWQEFGEIVLMALFCPGDDVAQLQVGVEMEVECGVEVLVEFGDRVERFVRGALGGERPIFVFLGLDQVHGSARLCHEDTRPCPATEDQGQAVSYQPWPHGIFIHLHQN